MFSDTASTIAKPEEDFQHTSFSTASDQTDTTSSPEASSSLPPNVFEPNLTEAECNIRRRIQTARSQGRRRRLRIAFFLLAILCAECVSQMYIFRATVVEWASTCRMAICAHPRFDWKRQFGVHVQSLGSAVHFAMLALVPTDAKLVRLMALVFAVGAVVVWTQDLLEIREIAIGIVEHPDVQEYSSRAGSSLLIARVIAGAMFPVLALLALRALAIRAHYAGGEVHLWWRHPTRVALQRLWLTMQVALIWSIVNFAGTLRTPAHRRRPATP